MENNQKFIYTEKQINDIGNLLGGLQISGIQNIKIIATILSIIESAEIQQNKESQKIQEITQK